MILIVICGPTATGKSNLAIQLAKYFDSVIISADSRQVYQDFNIGTAKPSPREQQEVKHYMIDICHPSQVLTVAEYQQQTQQLLKGSEGPILLVGGTGLYIKSIVRGLKIPPVAPQPQLRSQLESLSQTELYQQLIQIDAIAARKIQPRDRVRTLRALEVYYVTGIPISAQQGEDPPLYPIVQIGLDCEGLIERITRRTETMLTQGLVAEVEHLMKKYDPELHLFKTLGYQEIKQYLKGDITLEQAKDLTIIHTRQFAKRQRTWFSAIPAITWLNANAEDLLEQSLAIIKQYGGKG
ncbi:tRNA (adenosine(37)-N6)-dimethylallyltransferase MiaA [Gloeocapsa sp. PCC 73106]|uniref:tRNA (adenosine(37)-N6)-dimethylallyltransferase MiaA n=1 Tax=Gloeocapsa sp. PCC 73106 TaxID=102232 RepID=UPI0002ABFBF0|nr:tRNA (adenosine(37)-N6)-dimethylallyltransferase MiaA [Gloeocapsa sp. PCC 73106]ELR98145.1 tRNA isopentenyltransferase MiaA [Gloeocapsa sp. PCC 73106]